MWGQDSYKVYIYAHGKMGSKENSEHFVGIDIKKCLFQFLLQLEKLYTGIIG